MASARVVAAAATVALFVLASTPLMLLVECSFNNQTELAHWSFDGTLSDMSKLHRGPAVPMGPNVALASDNDITGECGNGGFVQIRQPGYLDLPPVRFYAISFTVTFSMRIPRYPSSTQILFADWSSGQWQFISTLDAGRTISVILRRNIPTNATAPPNILINGTDPEQNLVVLTSVSRLPDGAWFDVAFQFNRRTRTANLFLDQKRVATATVRPSVTDVSLKASRSVTYQFGRKADDDGQGLLDADVRNLRIFGSAF